MSRRKVLNNKNVLNTDDEYVSKRKKLTDALKGQISKSFCGPVVDPECPIENGRIYTKGAVAYDANIIRNNNKFYKISIIEDSVGRFHLWFRWGRVGYRGQTLLRAMEIERAVDAFEEKFLAKTLNNFSDLKKFRPHPGKYDLVDYSKHEQAGSNLIVDENMPSTLDEEVKRLVDMICDWKMMEKHLRRLNYDTNSCITKAQIKSGLKSLSDIEKFILKSDFGFDFHNKVNEYYTRIPHHFGMSTPCLLNTLEDLKDEISLLETLASIHTLKNEPVSSITLHPSDRNYMRMKCDISVLDRSDKHFKLIELYVKNSHGKTHEFKLKVKSIFKVVRHGELIDKKLGNRMLLWHGSPVSNWFGILLKGLRIAPPEAPVTGYMFGKGIYFADCVTKSANYCCAEIGSCGFIGLSEVALGKQQLRKEEDYNASQLEDGCLSTKGLGKNIPAVRSNKTILLDDQSVVVPSGIQKETKNCKSDLLFNEYIVYNPSQVRLRFLVELEFLSKSSD